MIRKMSRLKLRFNRAPLINKKRKPLQLKTKKLRMICRKQLNKKMLMKSKI